MPFDPQDAWRQAIGHFDAGRFQDARKLLKTLGSLKPDFPPLLHLLGMCEFRIGDTQAALALLRRAVSAAPRLAPALSDYGNVLVETGSPEAALAAYRQAVDADSRNLNAIINLARLQASLGDSAAAIAGLDRAIARLPATPSLRWTRALILLANLDFQEGWKDYAVRWSLPGTLFDGIRRDYGLPAISKVTVPSSPAWIWTEQGIGDEILYATVLPDAIRHGWQIRLGCSLRLCALFRRSFPELDIHPVETVRPPDLSDCGGQLPIADLAARYRLSEASFKSGAAFLKADPVLRNRLREKYDRLAQGRPLVGLSWRSSNRFSAAAKSPPLETLVPLLKAADCTFVNLQYGPVDADLEYLRRESGAIILDDPEVDPLGDLDPHAAQISALDAVVTVSNTVVHLAGGLGIPTIVLLPRHSGLMWYWFRSGARSPWYSSLTLIRQDRIGDWSSPIAAATIRLADILKPARQ